jgi:hypothetical protein
MDDGAGGSMSEVDASDINAIPTLRTHTITSFTSVDTSKTYIFKVRATN